MKSSKDIVILFHCVLLWLFTLGNQQGIRYGRCPKLRGKFPVGKFRNC